jgi:hypothetical protein
VSASPLIKALNLQSTKVLPDALPWQFASPDPMILREDVVRNVSDDDAFDPAEFDAKQR